MRAAALAAATTGAALALAPSAAGHGSVRPTVATPGTTQQLTFLVLNARETGIVAFRLRLPEGATVEEVVARQPEWIATSTEGSVEWRGGPIPGRAFDSFRVAVRMPDREGTVAFTGTEVFPDGPGPPYRLDVVLAGATGATAAAEPTDEGARTLATAALLVAVVAALLAAAALAVSLARRRATPR